MLWLPMVGDLTILKFRILGELLGGAMEDSRWLHKLPTHSRLIIAKIILLDQKYHTVIQSFLNNLNNDYYYNYQLIFIILIF